MKIRMAAFMSAALLAMSSSSVSGNVGAEVCDEQVWNGYNSIFPDKERIHNHAEWQLKMQCVEGLTVKDKVIVGNKQYRLFYAKVYKGDKIRTHFSTFGNTKSWHSAFSEKVPEEGMTVENNIDHLFDNNDVYQIDIEKDGYLILTAWGNGSDYNFMNVFRVNPVVNDLKTANRSSEKQTAILEANKEFMMGGKRCYGHLFIDQIYGTDPAIPCQSLFDVNATARLGIRYIELNAISTKDGVLLPIHGYRGTFGREVVDKDGGFSHENTKINSVTYDWIKENLRYSSKYEKHRTTIPTLEEAFAECRRNGISVLVSYMSATKKLARKYFGDNIILYVYDNGGKDVRNDGYGGYVMNYSSSDTKETILKQCEDYGAPYLHCLDSPSFEKLMKDGTMEDVIHAVHEKGCMIGIAGSYTPTAQTMKFFNLGGDFSATASFVNDFENGNICNLKGDIDYSDFEITKGKVRNGILHLADGGKITKKLPDVYLGKGSLKIKFKGILRVDYFGHDSHKGVEIKSDGKQTEWISTYFLEQSPTFKVTAVGDVEISMIDYKASKC